MNLMDLGPFQSGSFKVGDQFIAKGIAVRLKAGSNGEAILFDTELLRPVAAWSGGFVHFAAAMSGVREPLTLGAAPW